MSPIESENRTATWDIRQFTGPLDLLNHIIENKKADLQNLPIVEITEQYLEVIQQTETADLDMELASQFIVMGSTLLHLKSLLLLPERIKLSEEEGEDPREELIFRLMIYRRAKAVAKSLEERFTSRGRLLFKAPEPPSKFGAKSYRPVTSLSLEQLLLAAQSICERNKDKLSRKETRLKSLLHRERFSVREQMTKIIQWLEEEPRFFFDERYPRASHSTAERVSAFLALLELVRENRIRLTQRYPFSTLLLERIPESARENQGKKTEQEGTSVDDEYC